MRLLFVLLLLFGFGSKCFSQVYGFMGKRFAANVSTHFSPNLFGKDISSTTNRSFNLRYSFGAEYVLSNKWSVSTSFHIQNTATNKLAFDDPIETGDNKDLAYKITSNGFSLSFSRFLLKNNDFIAPVGKYISLGILISNFSLIDSKGHVFEPNTKISSASNTGLTFGLGRKRVLFEHFLISYGVEAAYLFYTRPFNGEDKFNELIDIPKKRMQQVSLLNLTVSVGYLF